MIKPGKSSKPILSPIQKTDFFAAAKDVAAIVKSLEELRASVSAEHEVNRAEHKARMASIDSAIAKARITTGPEGTPGKDADHAAIVEEVFARIPTPQDGKSVSLEEVVSEVMNRINVPKDGKDAVVDHDRIAAAVLPLIPKPKDGKDGASVTLAEVLKELKKSLTLSDIPGIKEAIDSYSNQAAMRGYLHGGGDTVTAGTGVMITSDANGKKIISVAGSTGTAVYNELVSGSGTAFVLANIPTVGTVRVYARGQRLTLGTDYTISGKNITTTDTWSAGDLTADYSK